MEHTQATDTKKRTQWLIAAVIALVFFAGGYFIGQAHGGQMPSRGDAQNGQWQGGQNRGAGMPGRQGMTGPQGSADVTASGTPAQMPAQQ